MQQLRDRIMDDSMSGGKVDQNGDLLAASDTAHDMRNDCSWYKLANDDSSSPLFSMGYPPQC